jgi:hypothetical protein
VDPYERPTGYVSIHERRLEMIERTIWSRPAARDAGGDLGGDFETMEIGSIAGLVAGFVGLAIQGVSAAFPYLLAAWIAPPWFLGIQYIGWALGFRAAVRRRDEHPWQTLAIPLVSIALWLVALYVGTTQLGWQPARFPTSAP